MIPTLLLAAIVLGGAVSLFIALRDLEHTVGQVLTQTQALHAALATEGARLMATIQDAELEVQAAITENSDVIASGIATLELVATKLEDAIANGATSDELLDFAGKIRTNSAALAASIAANTPAA